MSDHRNKAVADYLVEFTGQPVILRPLAQSDLTKIPFLLRDSYDLTVGECLGRTFTLAFSTPGQNPSPNTAAKHADVMRTALGTEVALAFAAMPAYNRQRLVAQGTAFVVPGSQLFLPFLAMDLRSRSRPAGGPREHEGPMIPAAQLLLLYHLQRRQLDNMPHGDVGQLLGCSSMSVSRAVRDLAGAGLCDRVVQGVSKSVRFRYQGRELWDAALPLTRTPVKAAVALDQEPDMASAPPRAGVSALSAYSLLDGGGTKTVAVAAKGWSRTGSGLREHPWSSDTPVLVELWRYDPTVLAHEGLVDRLSLYLSMSGDPDERVQSSLEDLLGGVEW